MVGKFCSTRSCRNPAQSEASSDTFNRWPLRSILSSLFQPVGEEKTKKAVEVSVQVFKASLEWHLSFLLILPWRELSVMATLAAEGAGKYSPWMGSFIPVMTLSYCRSNRVQIWADNL